MFICFSFVVKPILEYIFIKTEYSYAAYADEEHDNESNCITRTPICGTDISRAYPKEREKIIYLDMGTSQADSIRRLS